MKKSLAAAMLLSAVTLEFFTITDSVKAAYIDNSIYKLETSQKFASESEASQAVAKLKKDTGWKADYQKSGTSKNYQISASGLTSETNAKSVLSDFTKQTGIKGTSSPTGSKQPYYTAVSGTISGEQQANNLLDKMKKETGLTGTVKPNGVKQPYISIVTSELTSEASVKAAIQELKKQTGVNANYQKLEQEPEIIQIQSGKIQGEKTASQVKSSFQKDSGLNATLNMTDKGQSYYIVTTNSLINKADEAKSLIKQLEQSTGVKSSYKTINNKKTITSYNIETGYFNGLSMVKNAISQIKNNTGIKGTYQKVGATNNYFVKMKDVSPEKLKSLQAFFKKKRWHMTYTAVKKTSTQTTYQVITNAVTNAQADKAVNFLSRKKLKSSKSNSGKTIANQYQLLSQQTADKTKVTKGLNSLKKSGINATAKSIKKSKGITYKIKTEALLETAKINKVQSFFKTKKLTAVSEKTGKSGYTQYQVTVADLLNQKDIDRVLTFFKTNNAKGNAKQNGKSTYTQYKLVTDQISTSSALNKGLSFFKAKNLPASYTTKNNPIYSIVITEQFTGKSNADKAASKVKQLYGWAVSSVEVKSGPQIMETNYNITMSEMVAKQLKANPQTDSSAYVSLSYINSANSTVTADFLNVRSTPEVKSNNIIGTVTKGYKVNIISVENNWAKIKMGWRKASEEEVSYYVNPANFSVSDKSYFQFLKLSKYAGLTASEVNTKILKGKGILEGKGEAFIKAAESNSINELYLISHALLETGNGTSELANGVTYNGKKVYNMYGIGAYDGDAVNKGAQYAYNQGWFSPEAAITGGAKFIGQSYIHNAVYNQDTLYKMRWEPSVSHQYASDIGWAYKQVNRMYSLYSLLDNYQLYYDIPVYK
ncbi:MULTISPECIES: N-acetylglucosaminidase [Bacillus amyloliquefaciens group]|uniref:N-acetylglucosaminidase n=1 Tax=Bacillus amyloliquefaciens group TaxID=1938374 RepID=UPI000CA2F1B9|nr:MULTISPECIES: N-acetylglucosaminidase [Bacillus amyloliquefaciens group]ATX84911.1 beta-N-acetylglucosaminidase [Bacillus velezensis]